MLRVLKITLNETLIMSISEFTILLMKAPFSFFFLAKNAIYSEIIPYKYKIQVMIIDSIFKNQHSLLVSYRYYLLNFKIFIKIK